MHASHLQRVRKISVAVSKFSYINHIFTETLAKINREYTEKYCWCRNCCQWSTALLETCLSSSKTTHQHIALMTWSIFCAIRHPFLNYDVWPANISPVDYHILWCCLSEIQVPTQHNNGLFSKPSTFSEKQYNLAVRWTSSAFHKVVWWYFWGVVDKCTILVWNFFLTLCTKNY